jgi:hypothetical protein
MSVAGKSDQERPTSGVPSSRQHGEEMNPANCSESVDAPIARPWSTQTHVSTQPQQQQTILDTVPNFWKNTKNA